MHKRLKELAAQADADAEPLRFSLGGQNYQQVRDERFAELVRQDEANGMRETYMKMIQGAIAEEREACAAVVEGRLSLGLNFEGCAATIRARGNHEQD